MGFNSPFKGLKTYVLVRCVLTAVGDSYSGVWLCVCVRLCVGGCVGLTWGVRDRLMCG